MSVRRFLVEMMCHFSKEAVPVIVTKARGSVWYFQRNCAIILGRSKDQRALPFLRTLFRHEKPQVRKESLRAMFYMGDRGRRALIDFSMNTSSHPSERKLAQGIIERMTG